MLLLITHTHLYLSDNAVTDRTHISTSVRMLLLTEHTHLYLSENAATDHTHISASVRMLLLITHTHHFTLVYYHTLAVIAAAFYQERMKKPQFRVRRETISTSNKNILLEK